MPLATYDCPHHCDGRLWPTLLRARRWVEDDSSELSILPDYTAECSDELILDDATASTTG